jgi:AbrB family looped-hinge helix DNA binding protein
MAKVTSKRQVTIPKHIADEYGIEAGDEISWIAEGSTIRVVPGAEQPAESDSVDVEERLRLYDRATVRQRRRQGKGSPTRTGGSVEVRRKRRGWSREDLYDRGVPR